MRAILTWHSLDDSRSPISVTPAHFRRQLAWIEEAGLRVVPLADLLALPDDIHAIAITFDDGFANFATEAAPSLRERGWPVALFVVTDHVGGDNRWRGETSDGIPVLPLLDWDGLSELAEDGVTVANHTRTHPHLDRLVGTSVAAEIDGAANALQARLGRAPEGIAYPYGDCDANTIAAARPRHRWGVTTEFRPLHAGVDPLALPRLDAWYFRTRAHFTSWGSARFRAWVWMRRAARTARAAIPHGRRS
jgi:peptidoglycan/xylan/chitin deacetylase (PgdA/CDA1 family)